MHRTKDDVSHINTQIRTSRLERAVLPQKHVKRIFQRSARRETLTLYWHISSFTNYYTIMQQKQKAVKIHEHTS